MQKKLAVILVLIIVLASGIYFFSQKKSDSSSKTPEEVAVEQAQADCKYDKDICAYFAAQALAMQSGVTITSSSKIANYGLSRNEMKIDGAGNMEINTYKDGQLESSTIIFENTTYFKDKDGMWYAVGEMFGQDQESFKKTLNEVKATYEEKNGEMQIKKIGEELCGNLTCDKYQTILSENGSTTTIDILVDREKHLARKMEFSFNEGVMTMEYGYEAVSISKPSPIKELPSLDASSDSSASSGKMPSAEEIKAMMEAY